MAQRSARAISCHQSRMSSSWSCTACGLRECTTCAKPSCVLPKLASAGRPGSTSEGGVATLCLSVFCVQQARGGAAALCLSVFRVQQARGGAAALCLSVFCVQQARGGAAALCVCLRVVAHALLQQVRGGEAQPPCAHQNVSGCVPSPWLNECEFSSDIQCLSVCLPACHGLQEPGPPSIPGVSTNAFDLLSPFPAALDLFAAANPSVLLRAKEPTVPVHFSHRFPPRWTRPLVYSSIVGCPDVSPLSVPRFQIPHEPVCFFLCLPLALINEMTVSC
jgi:hypothetical protein